MLPLTSFILILYLAIATAALPGYTEHNYHDSDGISRSVYVRDNTFIPLYSNDVKYHGNQFDNHFDASLVKTNDPQQICTTDTKMNNMTAANAGELDSCLNLYDFVAGINGYWDCGFEAGQREAIVMNGGCCFYAWRVDNSLDHVSVGNVDITKIFDKVINDFSENGRVGALGAMNCTQPTASQLEWMIFSPPSS